MSPSLQLVCGPGAGDASACAAELALAAADAGRPVTLLALDPYDGATARVTDPRVTTLAGDDAATPPVASELLAAVGVPSDLLDDLHATTTAAHLRLLWSVPVEAGPEHVVVIDAGAAGPELARLGVTLPRTVRRAMPLGGGMLRSKRPLLAAALGDRWPAAAVTDGIARAAERATRLRQAFSAPTSGAVVVGDPGDRATERQAVGVALSAVRVRLMPTVPPGSTVPTGSTVPPGSTPDLPALLAAGPRVIDIQARGDGYLWRMPLPLNDFRELRLRLLDDALALSAQGHGSVLDLPTALRRCHPSRARLRDGMLEVAFDPSTQQGATS
ncbi:hypothetical protein HJ588_11175 [Flexivirga sp. ID2601S]|uniref:ArsA HSP20-like domain-containing protein n=1 Tax=Flexivirga aerilata TaxID=1656889 RepID=A0A849AIP7_9MICO|nr:hypothetical protein [Flexivirga aerilata]NNG39833.1 hypothetical protein [Flexivirga aerilata]